jgi:hypothetical protein
MEQIMTAVPAQKSSFHSRAAAATVADVIRMSLRVLDGRPGAPLDNPSICWCWLKGRGSGGTR